VKYVLAISALFSTTCSSTIASQPVNLPELQVDYVGAEKFGNQSTITIRITNTYPDFSVGLVNGACLTRWNNGTRSSTPTSFFVMAIGSAQTAIATYKVFADGIASGSDCRVEKFDIKWERLIKGTK
jgi:hypothetical protein